MKNKSAFYFRAVLSNTLYLLVNTDIVFCRSAALMYRGLSKAGPWEPQPNLAQQEKNIGALRCPITFPCWAGCATALILMLF